MVYHGCLTFFSLKPERLLTIPNEIVARRIVKAVLNKYRLNGSLSKAFESLTSDGDIEPVLKCYRDLMLQRDVGKDDLIKKTEENHRDSFHFTLLRNPLLHPEVEFQVTKVIHCLVIA
jgi:hypothetical protein